MYSMQAINIEYLHFVQFCCAMPPKRNPGHAAKKKRAARKKMARKKLGEQKMVVASRHACSFAFAACAPAWTQESCRAARSGARAGR